MEKGERKKDETIFAGSLSKSEEAQLAKTVAQDRSVLVFHDFELSKDGAARKEGLGQLLVQRNEWLGHHAWTRRPQMPTFHVKFRQGMQKILQILSDWYLSASRDASPAAEACRQFTMFREGLRMHVRIEEKQLFPQLQRWHPRVDTSFLYVDHARLHELEEEVARKFRSISTMALYGHVERDDKAELLRSLLAFDKCLITHLGEEEDIIVPLTLNAPE